MAAIVLHNAPISLRWVNFIGTKKLFAVHWPATRKHSPGSTMTKPGQFNPPEDDETSATSSSPPATVGQVAWLEVVEVNELGAFADWGLPKDLFIPFAEQQYKLRQGEHALVWIYLDKQQRPTGSTRIDHWIKDDPAGLEDGQSVSLIIADRTELGWKAVINHRTWGLLYSNELFRPLHKGETTTGYIKRIRADGKTDLSLQQPGFSKDRLSTVATQILQMLETSGGELPLTEKSPPEAIYAAFGVSKKVFKQAIGTLLKQRRINLQDGSIRLAPPAQ